MPYTQGNPGRGTMPRRGADTHAPDPPPTGRPSPVSPVAVLLGALALVVSCFVPAGGHRPWPAVVVLGAVAVAAQTGTTLRLRRERARVALIVARHAEAARRLPYFG